MQSGGVANTSLDSVLEASRASKSQLYHYFKNKDDLVLAVIRRQTECVLETHEALLRGLSSISGLRRWRDAVVELTQRDGCAGGCPLGSLASELGELPLPRAALANSFAEWQFYFEAGFARIQARLGSSPSSNLAELAEAMLAALQGGLLLAQTARSTRPLELALDMAIDHVATRLDADVRSPRMIGPSRRRDR
jgi:AcrR family transcriptional regulator